ncbi:phage protease [Meridianimarinicoccus sp. RP-17]|uniref:phage protease n=1 Tax=Meridianimarinicoccus zhengii TaxID=2056810 RepID=UPI000DAE3078|nr:phage protease [Phycocomes zhengii]
MTVEYLERVLCNAVDLHPAASGAGQWAHLVPLGRVTGRDGRTFIVRDPHSIVQRSLHGGRELPVDYEHEMDTPRAPGAAAVPAAGWIKELQVRADGIWGRVEWTERAGKMVAAREYRFLSPVLYHAKDRTVMRIAGAGLVHRPNLELKSLSSEDSPMTDTPTAPGAALAQIAEALGLHAEATSAEIVTAIQDKTTPDPAQYVPIEAVKELLAAGKERFAAMSEDKARQKVDDATTRGYITPGMRGWAMALCAQDPERFDEFLSCSVPAYAHLHHMHTHGAGLSGARGAHVSGDEAEILRHMGIDPAKMAD